MTHTAGSEIERRPSADVWPKDVISISDIGQCWTSPCNESDRHLRGTKLGLNELRYSDRLVQRKKRCLDKFWGINPFVVDADVLISL